jgi:hypothetical protein
MLEHGVIGRETDGTVDAHSARPRLHTLELDPVVEVNDVDSVESVEEVEVPPRPAELPIGRQLQSRVSLLSDDSSDLSIFDRPQASVVENPGRVTVPRLFESR